MKWFSQLLCLAVLCPLASSCSFASPEPPNPPRQGAGGGKVNEMAHYVKAQDWAKAIPAAEAVLAMYEKDRTHPFYATAFLNNDAHQAGRLDMLMMLSEAYEQSGNQKDALLTYGDLYRQNLDNVHYSARACLAITEIMWERNMPATGDRQQGNFLHSDRWQAWNTARDYVSLLRRNRFEEKMNPADSALFRKVVQAAERYGADAAVQQEEAERRQAKRTPGPAPEG